MKKSLAFLSSALLLTTAYLAGNDKNLPKDFSPKHSKAIAFTENKGQVYDQNYKARPDVLYGTMTGNLAVHIKKTGVSYQLYRVDEWKEVEDEFRHEKRKEIEKQSIYRIDLNWLNANTNFKQSTDEALPGYNNYYLESCPNGALNIKSYTGITLHNLYNGINLHYYEKNGELKHDYIVAPHADYKQIQIEVKGAEVSVNKDGSLTLKTPLGDVQEDAPLVYQNNKLLNTKWILNRNILSFEIENYNPNFELIIDPITRLWGTYYGSSVMDIGYSCATDALKNVFLAGTSVGSTGTIIATVGSHQTTIGGSADAFLVKFNANGIRIWGTYYGGNANEQETHCCTDLSGNVYLTGATNSSGSVIATSGCHQNTPGGNIDAFLVKFDSFGVRQWGTFYGEFSNEYGRSCCTDASGNVFLAGQTAYHSGTVTVIATPGSHQTLHGGSDDAFLVKFNSSGVRQWGTYYGDWSNDYGFSCSSDAAGNVYLAGFSAFSTGTVIATNGSHQSAIGAGADAFLVKFNTTGQRLWGTYYGGSGNDFGYSCATDGTGNVFLSGQTESNTGTIIATSGGFQNAYGGGSNDAFLVKFNGLGIRQWGTYYGGSGSESELRCSTDAVGNVFLAGSTTSNSGTVIATTGSHQFNHGGGTFDALMVQFDATGMRQYATYYGGSGGEFGSSCTTDAAGHVYMVGRTDSNTGTIIATSGAHQSVYGGGSENAFLVKFGECLAINPVASASDSLCEGANITISALVSGTNSPAYSWSGPNSFTSSIQNPTISSASPVNVGVYTLTINNGGCIETATTQVSTIYPQPTITVNNGTICSGQSFTIVPSGASTYTIQGGNSVVSPNTSTSYTVSGSSSDGCLSANTATANVLVNSLPVISISAASSVICVGESIDLMASGANSYTWHPLAYSSSITVSPSITTVYSVTGQDGNTCENTSAFTLQVDECTGIANTLKSEAGIVLYPNPNNGEFYIESPSDFDIKIYNSIGQLILQQNLSEGKNQINLNEHANSIYLIEINQNGKTNRMKLIKE